MTHNQINYWSLKENVRHNQEYEAETKRHNIESERIGERSNEVSYLQAQAALQNAATNWYLAPSKEFNNYAVAPKNAAVAIGMLAGKWIKEQSTDSPKSGTLITIDNSQPNVRNQRLVTDPHGGQLYVTDY